MEEKKEKFEFLKKVSEKFSTLDDQKKKVLSIVTIIIIALIVITIISSIILGQTVGSAGKVTGNLRNSGFAVGKGKKTYVSSTIITDPDSGKNGVYEINSKGGATLID